MSRVFISYRRDDAAGYAGRLEEALETRLGRGSVFRDVLDIPPGDDFVAAIRQRLAQSDTVLVLIGPRWAGEGGSEPRRIDDPQDFVRLEVAAALESGVRVVPVLLPGATMPAESALPDELRALARRNAITLADPSWSADVGRLVSAIGSPPPRARWPWVAGAAALALCAVTALWLWRAAPPELDASDALVGTWHATVRYAWGDSYEETFEFERHAGMLTGSATFLRYPRAIEELRVEGENVHFITRSIESMGESQKEMTHSYSAELRDGVLAFRLLSTGGHTSNPPIAFEARRAEVEPTP